MEYRPPLPLGVVAIEKGPFRSPLNNGRQRYYIYHHGVPLERISLTLSRHPSLS